MTDSINRNYSRILNNRGTTKRTPKVVAMMVAKIVIAMMMTADLRDFLAARRRVGRMMWRMEMVEDETEDPSWNCLSCLGVVNDFILCLKTLVNYVNAK